MATPTTSSDRGLPPAPTTRGAAVRGFLAPYRVLDLTDARGLLAGWMLARLGADVIQVEPPGGSSARRWPPLVDGNSLYWSAYAAGKRSVRCDLHRPEGRALLLRLVERADILLETAAPGELEALGLGQDVLRAANRGLVHVSITPFGSNGPKARYADSDLVVWAAGGALWPARGPSNVPLRISVPQAYLHGAADAAAGALVALFARHASGAGQHVDISAQQSASLATLSTTLAAAVGHANYQFPADAPRKNRQLDLSGSGARTRRSKWPVADGLLEMHLGMGPAAGGSANRLFAWMRERGALPAEFDGWDWIKLPQRILADEVDDAQLDRARDAVAAFLRPCTKQQLMEEALARGILMAPAMTIGDLAGSPQLRERGYFAKLDEHGRERLLPVNFAAGCPQAFVAPRAVPDCGEHDAEVYGGLLGLDGAELARLARLGITA